MNTHFHMHACEHCFGEELSMLLLLSAMLNKVLFPVPDSACQQQHVMPALLRMSHSVLQCVCSVQSYWTDWSEWGPCSTTACDDVGIQVRQRKCVNTQPLPLLLVPACQGHHSERRECSTPPCTGENHKIYQHLTCASTLT